MKPLVPALFAAALLAPTAAPAGAAASGPVVIGSKKFTESVILAEIAAGLLRDARVELTLRSDLGGTRLLWNALRAGDIDLYPDYTGTIRHEILAGEAGDRPLAALAAARGVALSGALGFNNTYAIGMKESLARKLGIERISDLRGFPALRFGFTSEFMDRADGWPGLRRHYGLPQASVRGLDHDLAYRGLASDGIDVTDAYSTDAEIRHYRLRVLDDDLEYFPAYQALFVYRTDLLERAPRAVAVLERLVGAITARDMIRMNAAVKIEGRSEGAVAAEFLAARFGIESTARPPGRGGALFERTIEHVTLVGWSLSAAIVLAIPLGIAAARGRRVGQIILTVVGVIQTVPSLALLVFMIPLLGIGTAPALAALFLYSLLPIVRNTHAGITGIDPLLIESADAMGLPRGARLRRIELPLASPSILAGIKTSAVINVGTATLGALIGAGGYGQPILTGIRLDDTSLILQGAVPAALLALTVQAVFDLLERALVPRGLRLGA